MRLLHKLKSVRWMEFSGLLVGAALAAIVILFLTVGFLTMRVQGFIGKEEYHLYCYFDRGLGLRVGTKVQVNGVEVGKVQALELTPDSRVKLTFRIDTTFRRWITSEARVYATRDQNLIADRVVNIEQPSGRAPDPAKILQDGGILYAGTAQDIETVIEKAVALLQTADTLAQKTNTLLNKALDPKSTLGALVGTRELYDQLLYQLSKVDQITTQTERIVSSLEVRFPPLLDRTDSLIGQVGRVGVKLDTISTQAMGLLGSVDTTIFAMNQIIGDLRVLTHGASQLLVDGDAKLERADNLMTGLSSFWFIRNRLPSKDTVPLFGEDQW